ncbi:hypothetical protein EHW66_19870 [Erwinia psidii]|uniref:glycoside hydrolase family 19 protein n=1 Tax=Erwinia psidii TaxID=69224 RepID=UPI00226AFED7|nr:hypothetical protein [Erwinia psidii]MCX8960194.1 hypothetical protein [Erwinia psidii]MCX8967150.1 hypothetical protein [Erwinia psidii]
MSVLPKISWPVPSNRGSDFANQEDLMSHLEGEATGWYMVGSNGMWHGGIHITNATTPWCALSSKTASELLDFPVPFKGEQSVRCMADGEVVAYRICRDYLTVPWEMGPLSVSGSFVLVRHYIQPGEKKENGLHFYTLYMHLAPYSAYASSENETHWIVNDKLPVFRREWTPDASAENRNTYRVATIPKGSLIEWDATKTSCSATGPKARRYGLVTFKGLSDKAKAKGTKTSLVEGQQYWILTDRDNLVPSSGAATRPSWWSHLLPPYAEPMQFDTVVCPTPYPISAGESIGHLGYFQIPKEGGYDVRYQVHIECLSADDTLPAFLKNPEKVGESTPIYLKCPSGLPLLSKDLKTKAMVSSGRTSQGEAVLKLGQVKTEKDAQGLEYWFLPYANGYVPKSNTSVETLSQYDLGKLGFTTTVDEAPSFDHLDGTTSPKGVVRSILNRLLDASSADTRLTHRTVPYNYQRLLNRIDSSVSPYSSQEYLSAIHNPSYSDVKNKMIVKHPSEWYHKKETSVWQSFLNKLTSDAPEWREYCEGYLDKMVWMQDASKLKLGSSLWHMHPVAFLGALSVSTDGVTYEQLKKVFPDASDTDINTVVQELRGKLKLFKLDTPTRLRHFFSQIRGEVGIQLKGRTEGFQFSPASLRSFSQYYRNHPSESEIDGYKKNSSGLIVRRADEQAIGRKHYLRLNGNRQSNPDDGYNFRGRGLIQVTGYGKYHGFMVDYSNYWGGDVPDTVTHAEMVNEMPYAIRSALWFWLHYEVYTADHGNGLVDVRKVTKKVNGGDMGLAERQSAYELCEKVFL